LHPTPINRNAAARALNGNIPRTYLAVLAETRFVAGAPLMPESFVVPLLPSCYHLLSKPGNQIMSSPGAVMGFLQ
jgi:hypothetical protein